jgi:hypothetical protein
MGWEGEAARKTFRETKVFKKWLGLKGEAEVDG